MRTDKPIGLYVHIPFCIKKCNYCDFASFSLSNDIKERYIDALCREASFYKDRNLHVDTVFFGGGTPSLLEPCQLERIMAALRSAFFIEQWAEISAEVNPATLTDKKADAFLSAGFNRFSIGVQSICENELKILGRIHNFEDFYSTYKMLRSHGAGNIGVDLMFGIPEQTMQSFTNTLDKIVSLSPEHISVYGLMIEEGTPFFGLKDILPLPDEDAEREMYFAAAQKLADAGYSHYEISNFARPGYESRHNLKYWNLNEYLGLGLAAHSYLDREHFSNPDAIEDYLLGKTLPRELTSSSDERFEYAMLRLRTKDGIDLSEYRRRFDEDFLVERDEKISFYEKHGFIKKRDGKIALTEEGFYVSNSILSDLL